MSAPLLRSTLRQTITRRAAFLASSATAILAGHIPIRAQGTKLVVAWGSAVVSYLPLWIASDTGIFKKHGLDVDLRYIASAVQMPAILANEIQVAQAGGGEICSANAAGADLIVVGVLSPIIPYKLMVSADIRTIADLKGKRVGVSRFGDASDTGARLAIRRAGLDPAEVTFLQVGSNATRTAALLSGSVQGTVAMAPTDLDLERRGMHAVFDISALRIPAPDVSMTFRRSWIKDHPTLVQAYVDSIVEGWTRMRADRTLGIATLKAYFKSDDDGLMAHGYDYAVKTVLATLPFPRAEQFRSTLEELTKTNPLVAKIDPNTIVDDSYMRAAAARYKIR
jgi:NitT/TauT family transport system substrate-binding protein